MQPAAPAVLEAALERPLPFLVQDQSFLSRKYPGDGVHALLPMAYVNCNDLKKWLMRYVNERVREKLRALDESGDKAGVLQDLFDEVNSNRSRLKLLPALPSPSMNYHHHSGLKKGVAPLRLVRELHVANLVIYNAEKNLVLVVPTLRRRLGVLDGIFV